MASRQANKERTKLRLIQATLKVLIRKGPLVLTTGRVTRAAGVAQPTFYVHFKGMNEALDQGASFVVQRIDERLDAELQQTQPTGHVNTLSDRIATIVRALSADPAHAELFLRHRRDMILPVGRQLQRVSDRVRKILADNLATIWPERSRADLDIHVELLMGMVFGLVEGIVDHRVEDVEQAATAAANLAFAGVNAATKVADAA